MIYYIIYVHIYLYIIIYIYIYLCIYCVWVHDAINWRASRVSPEPFGALRSRTCPTARTNATCQGTETETARLPWEPVAGCPVAPSQVEVEDVEPTLREITMAISDEPQGTIICRICFWPPMVNILTLKSLVQGRDIHRQKCSSSYLVIERWSSNRKAISKRWCSQQRWN